MEKRKENTETKQPRFKSRLNKCNMENEMFFLILADICLNTKVRKFYNFNIGAINAIQRNLSACTKWANKLKVRFYYRFCSKFILSFACNPAFYFNTGKRLLRFISFSSIWFCYYRKHPNNDSRICPLSSSTCFQQYFYDWFSVVRYNLDLEKLQWTPILFNFN